MTDAAGWVPIDLLPSAGRLTAPLYYGIPGEMPDPFTGSPIQTNRLQAFCIITYGGVDVTSRLDPHLISLRIVLRDISTCEIELDDRNGQLPIPPLNAPIQIALGWMSSASTIVFDGYQTDLEYTHARDGGRRMIVHGESINRYSQAKQPGDDNMGTGAPPGQDQGPLHDLQGWMNQLAGNGKLSLSASAGAAGVLSGIQKDFWEQNKSSPMNELGALSQHYGLIHQFTGGNQIKIMMAGEGGPGIVAQVGVNLISCRVRPLSARGSWAGGQQHYFKPSVGQWMGFAKGFNLPGPWGSAVANWLQQGTASHESEAQGDNDGAGNQTGQELGQGRILINGEPTALFNCPVTIVGVRPGVDGAYIAYDAVEHLYTRRGYITILDVRVDATVGASGMVGTAYSTAISLGAALAQEALGVDAPFIDPSAQLPPLPLPPNQIPSGVLPTGLPVPVPPMVGTPAAPASAPLVLPSFAFGA